MVPMPPRESIGSTSRRRPLQCRWRASSVHPSVVVRKSLDVCLVEFAKRDLKDSSRGIADTRQAMGFSRRDKELVTFFGNGGGVSDVNLNTVIQDNPQLLAPLMALLAQTLLR